jgi:hypothetical protein
VARRLLVARVYEAQATVSRRLEDRVEVPAMEGEQGADPGALERPDQELAAVDTRHAPPPPALVSARHDP